MRAAVLSLSLLALAGCGSTRDANSSKQKQQVEAVTADATITVPVNGVPIPVPMHLDFMRTLKSEESGTSHEERKIVMPDLGALLTLATKTAASGGLGPVPQGVGIALTLAASALAAYKTAKASSESQRADTHEAANDELYADLKKATKIA